MAPDQPGRGDGAHEDDFDALERRAAAAAERGAARADGLAGDDEAPAAPRPRRSTASTVALVVVLAVVFLAGALAGRILQGGPSDDRDSSRAPAPTSSQPAQVTTSTPGVSGPTPTSAATTLPMEDDTAPTPPELIPPPTTPAPPSGDASNPQMMHTVRTGESFWAIAEAEVARVTQQQPDLSQVDSYWRVLVRANAERLVQPGNANLLYVGQVLQLPAVTASP